MGEFLVMHNPALNFSPKQQMIVYNVFREHVEKRGLEKDGHLWQRRPRTLIFSTQQHLAMEVVDRVIHCELGKVLEVDKMEEKKALAAGMALETPISRSVTQAAKAS